jgi:hydroxymethylglutaryl-CoA synthase
MKILTFDVEQIGKNILVFSYGSGLTSSLFVLNVHSPVTQIVNALNVEERLAARIEVSPSEFLDCITRTEEVSHLSNYVPLTGLELIVPSSYYLDKIDQNYKRSYSQK